MKKLDNRIIEISEEIQDAGRRNFLKISSVAAGLMAAGVTGVIGPVSALAALPEGINHMTESEHAVFHRLMEVLLPTDGSTLVSPKELPVLQTVDGGFLAGMPPHVLNVVKGGVAYFNDAPKKQLGKPFTDLSDAEAVGFCDALATSEDPAARGLFTALKFLVVTAYWAIPPAWGPTGFDGPVTEKWGLEYQGNAPLPKH